MTTKIEQFAKEQFGIELLPVQLEMIAMIAAGDYTVLQFPARAGRTTATKVAIAYLQDGLKAAEK